MTNGIAVTKAIPVATSAGSDLLQVFGTLFFLLGMAWVGLVWVRQRSWLQGAIRQKNRLRVEETRALGNRSHLHLVACGDQQFLVASSPAGVSLIADLMSAESMAAMSDPIPGSFQAPRRPDAAPGTAQAS
ncbi:MAG: FliO/MopB family protein [Verrucomicrobiota bacterium]